MLNGRLGIGVIGCGKIAQVRHLPEYHMCKNAELIGYFDFIPERAEKMAKKYGGVAFSSVQELLNSDKIDAVSVCTANITHAETAVAALRAKKHVLCEKPMAVTLSECENMLAEAKSAGKLLMVAHNQRLWNTHIKAKELLKKGVIGTPLTFKTCFGHRGPDHWSVDKGTGNWFFDKNKSAFGVVADLGIHKIDIIRYLLESEITELSAMTGTLDKRDADGSPVSVEDNAIILCKTESGVIGTVSVSWTYYGEEENGTVIYGTKGHLHIPSSEDGALTVTVFGKEPAVYSVQGQEKSGIIDAFIDAILNGKNSPISAESVIPSMKVMLSALTAADSGKRTHL